MANRLEEAGTSPVAVGTVLAGKYRVERLLGQGGMGFVVQARHLALDERVALKFLLPQYTHHDEAAKRFAREARAAVKIKSEHVARVQDVGTLETGAPYMVMEFLEGVDLSRLLERQGPVPIPDAVDSIIQACDAIAEAHSYGIVHRDLKPANLFLTRRPDGSPLVKVLDFGITKEMNRIDNLTQTTATMGSALYMSMEQMQNPSSVDQRTDIYALGATLYELLSNEHPYDGDSMPMLIAQVLTGTPTPIRSRRPDVPESLAAVIERALERDRTKRYQTVAELVIALAPFAPPRSQPLVERIARMTGMAPSLSGRSSSIPDVSVGQRATPPHASAQTSPQDTAGQILVPGYAGPVSVGASAAFAAGTSASAAFAAGTQPPQPRPIPPTPVWLIALIGISAAVIIGVILFAALRGPMHSAEQEDTRGTQGAPSAAPVPPLMSAAPPIVEPAPTVPAEKSAPAASTSISAAPPASVKALQPTSSAAPVTTRAPATSKPTSALPSSAPGTNSNAPPPVLTAR